MHISPVAALMTGSTLMLLLQTLSPSAQQSPDLNLTTKVSAVNGNRNAQTKTLDDACHNRSTDTSVPGSSNGIRNHDLRNPRTDPTITHWYNDASSSANKMVDPRGCTKLSSNHNIGEVPYNNAVNNNILAMQNTIITDPLTIQSVNYNSTGRSYLNGFFTDDLPAGDAMTPRLMGHPWDYTINYSYQDHWAGAGISGLKVSKFGAYPVIVGVYHADAGYNDFSAAAKGRYNNYYKTTAQSLIPYARYIYAVRIDHEFNGDWYPWSPFGGAGQIIDAPTWVAGWRNMAKAIRAALPNVKIIWNPNTGNGDPYPYYPGDDLVDIIGLDLYNQPINYKTSVIGWNDFLSGSGGNNLTTFAAFGRQHNKPLCFPEWGDSFGDGYFISEFGGWMDNNNVVAQTYWDSGQGLSSTSSLTKLPKNQAAYIAAFGHRPYTGTFWRKVLTPPKPPWWADRPERQRGD